MNARAWPTGQWCTSDSRSLMENGSIYLFKNFEPKFYQYGTIPVRYGREKYLAKGALRVIANLGAVDQRIMLEILTAKGVRSNVKLGETVAVQRL